VTEDEAAYWNGRMAEISGKMDDILATLTAMHADATKGHLLLTTLSQRMMRRSDAAE
jgi:hypothetical protein